MGALHTSALRMGQACSAPTCLVVCRMSRLGWTAPLSVRRRLCGRPVCRAALDTRAWRGIVLVAANAGSCYENGEANCSYERPSDQGMAFGGGARLEEGRCR